MPLLQTLNVKPATKEAVMSVKGRPGIRSVDEALQRILWQASALGRVMSYLRANHGSIFDEVHAKVISDRDE